MKAGQFFSYLFSIPKSVYFNLRTLPFRQAIKIPILISYHVKLQHLMDGVIKISDETPLKPCMISFGFNGTEEVAAYRSIINIRGGKMIFKGGCRIAEGCVIGVSGGTLTFGKNFSANKNFFVSCNMEITFGDDALLGWNTVFFDATGHIVYHKGEQKESYKPIIVGSHVWVCAETHVLKGAVIPDNSIVAYKSLVTGKFDQCHTLIGGAPAQILQSDISWGNFSKHRK